LTIKFEIQGHLAAKSSSYGQQVLLKKNVINTGDIPERLGPVGTNYFRRLFKDSLILNDLVLRTIRLHT